MKTITSQQYRTLLQLYQKWKHKFRENDFGVVVYIRYRLLSTFVGSCKHLEDNDKYLINNN